MLHELIYVSLSTTERSRDELSDMLIDFRQRNQALNITGMLVYHRREFMQLLEGEHHTVMQLYDAICNDPRHRQVHRIWDGPLLSRNFAEWAMAFAAPEEQALKVLPGYSDFLERGLATTSSSRGKRLLLSMRDDFLKHE